MNDQNQLTEGQNIELLDKLEGLSIKKVQHPIHTISKKPKPRFYGGFGPYRYIYSKNGKIIIIDQVIKSKNPFLNSSRGSGSQDDEWTVFESNTATERQFLKTFEEADKLARKLLE